MEDITTIMATMDQMGVRFLEVMRQLLLESSLPLSVYFSV